MAKELCPVKSVTKPVECKLEGTTAIYGRALSFPTSSDLGVQISVSGSYLPTTADVIVREGDQNPQTLLLNPSSENFARVWIRGDESMQTGAASLPRLLPTDTRVQQYTQEGTNRLHILSRGEYDFIVGQNHAGVVVDGWLKEAQSPEWRVVLPLNGSGVLIPNSVLLTCAQQ